MPSTRLHHAAGSLVLGLGLAAFAAPTVGAGDDPVSVRASASQAAEQSEIGPMAGAPAVTIDLTPSHTYAASPYADQARDMTPPPPPPPPTTTTTTTAPPPPPPPPAPAGSIEGIIEAHFGAAAGRAKAIARCESNMNPNAVSPTNDHGLFQINAVHRGQFEAVTGAPWSSVYDANLNTKYAKYLYDREGWGPWVCNRKV